MKPIVQVSLDLTNIKEALEMAHRLHTVILDKTGTITFGNRMATEFIPAPGVTVDRLVDAAQLASLADETPEGRSIVVLAKERYGLRGRTVAEIGGRFVPFTAAARMSGVDVPTAPGVAARVMIGAHYQQTRELAMGTGCRLQ